MSYYPSVIARPNAAGFAGRRVHSAGPPAHVIELLLRLHRDAFDRDLDAMRQFLINDHPGGWSQLGDDPTADTGWNNQQQFGRDGFVCYCHGDRNEAHAPFTQGSDASDTDWLYVLTATGISVSRAEWGDSEDDDTPPVWRHRRHVSWGGDTAGIPDSTAA